VTVEVTVWLQALALREQDGGDSIIVPALPGCVSQADSIEAIEANIVEAAEGWLAAGHDQAKEAAIRMVVG
jgi:predicted RNase H-like HicB family nuclease